MDSNKLVEGLEQNDLNKLVTPVITVDEYKSKMGDDEDICVICFTVKDKEPALDLASFIEKGYEWVLDADVSSGEIEGGDFLVFVEAERDDKIAENLFMMLTDILNLTNQKIEEWVARYPKTKEQCDISTKALHKMIPGSVDAYIAKVGGNDEQMESLRAAAGLNIKTVAPKNKLTDSVRFAAGLNIK